MLSATVHHERVFIFPVNDRKAFFQKGKKLNNVCSHAVEINVRSVAVIGSTALNSF